MRAGHPEARAHRLASVTLRVSDDKKLAKAIVQGRLFAAGDLHRARVPTTDDEQQAAQQYASRRRGRPLSLGEQQIDLVGIDRDLREGKARLAAAIDQEKRRALRQHLRTGRPVALQLTEQMRTILRQLYRAGQRHALQEIQAITGQLPPENARSMAGKPIGEVEAQLAALLSGYGKKLTKKTAGKIETAIEKSGAVTADLGTVASGAVAAEVMRLPGALDVASQIVSTGLFAGMGDVYDASSGLFAQWEYSSVLDDATCDECEAKDGTVYESWDEAQDDLPDGGPNPDCAGEGRCRCRLVPSMEAEPQAAPPSEYLPPPEAGGEFVEPPPEDWQFFVPAYRRPVASLTESDAKEELRKLTRIRRDKRWTMRQDTEKLDAFDRRIKALRSHIEGRRAPVVQVRREINLTGKLRPVANTPDEIAEAKALATKARQFIENPRIGEQALKREIQQNLGARLRTNADFQRSLQSRQATALRDRLKQFKPGEPVEIPKYPGYKYRVIQEADSEGRVLVEITGVPPGVGADVLKTKIGSRYSIDGGRVAIDLAPPPESMVSFKFKMPLDTVYSETTDVTEQAVSQLIGNWAGSSSSGGWAQAMQRAIADEFDLAESTVLTLKERYGFEEGAEIYMEHGAALRAFAREMYDATQEELRAKGITEIVVYRGQGFFERDYIEGFYGEHGARSVLLQPGSSFSADFDKATSFMRDNPGMIAARIPAERIIGTARSGFGCKHEWEYVVLGQRKGEEAEDLMTILNTRSGVWETKFYDGLQEVFSYEGQSVTPLMVKEVLAADNEILMSQVEFYLAAEGLEGSELEQMAAWVATHVHLPVGWDHGAGIGDTVDFIKQLGNVPMSVLDDIDVDIHFGAGGVPVVKLDELGGLAGKAPSTWTAGTWDEAAGVYKDGVIALNPAASSSSTSPLLHEIGHAVDAADHFSSYGGFVDLWQAARDDGLLSPYFSAAGQVSGSDAAVQARREWFAEMFATWYKSGIQSNAYFRIEQAWGKDVADWMLRWFPYD